MVTYFVLHWNILLRNFTISWDDHDNVWLTETATRIMWQQLWCQPAIV